MSQIWSDELKKTIKAKFSESEYLEIFPKTILNKVTSPDIGFMYSMRIHMI